MGENKWRKLMCVYIFSRKKFYTCVLLLLALGVVNAQRRIEVTQLRSGAYHSNTGRFELTTEQINTEAVIETDLITVGTKKISLSAYSVEQIGDMFTIRKWDGRDSRGRSCYVFLRQTHKRINDGSFVMLVYPDSVYQYYFRRE